MLLAWGLTTNPQSVKIYRANAAEEPIYNGFTFIFSTSYSSTTQNKIKLKLTGSNVLCGTLTHTLPLLEDTLAVNTCTCSGVTQEVLCETAPIVAGDEYSLKIRVGWDYDGDTNADIDSTFGQLSIYTYDDSTGEYSSESIFIDSIPNGDRTTATNK